MSTSLCPAAVNTDHPPAGCTMFDHDCVSDPDLECEWFIGYLHNVLFGDKTIRSTTMAVNYNTVYSTEKLPFGGSDEAFDKSFGPGKGFER